MTHQASAHADRAGATAPAIRGSEPAIGLRVPVLSLRGISKTFNGVMALSDVSLDAYAGEVLALMGENGAGKSTLIKTLTGAVTADPGGRFEIDGRDTVITSPEAARNLGIAVIYQELSLAPNLSVAENIFLGRALRRRGCVDRRAMEAACAPLLQKLGADFTASDKVKPLSIAQRQLVEVARALQFRARVLIMDEPTTPLSERETSRLFERIHQLRADGMAIIYISHRMTEVYQLADRVGVLRDGRHVGTLQGHEIEHGRVVRMMVGRDASGLYQHQRIASPEPRRAVLQVRGVADGRRVHGCTFSAFAGEVLGVAGLVGSGRTELARLVFGAERRLRGTVLVDGMSLNGRSPAEAIRAGLVYLTEDRKGQGLFLDASVQTNINTISARRDAYPAGVLNRPKASARAAAAMRRLLIRAADDGVQVGSLSGGNQQKVLLARLLEIAPSVLVLDEPTRGVDIGAKAEIYRAIDQLAAAGVAVVVISSDLPEVTAIADRILVMRDGRIVGELGGTDQRVISQEAVMALATASNQELAS